MGLDWPWIGELVGFITVFVCFPAPAEFGESQTPCCAEYCYRTVWIPGPIPSIVPPHCDYEYTSRPSWLLGGTLEVILVADPRECGYTLQPTSVCLHTLNGTIIKEHEVQVKKVVCDFLSDRHPARTLSALLLRPRDVQGTR